MLTSSVDTTQLPKEKKYPYMGRYAPTALIVLFISPRRGFVVYPGETEYPLGDLCLEWLEHEFQLFSGRVTIEQ